MSWKYIFNGNNFKDYIRASAAAETAGYKFFLYCDVVYFRDEITLHVFDTGIREKDLI